MNDKLSRPVERAVVSEPTPAPDPFNPEPGLRIRHHVPQNHETSIKRPCVWCGQPTDILAETPFAPELGALPLMLTCGAHMRIVYRAFQAGQPLDAWEQEAVRCIIALKALPSGKRTHLLVLSSHAILEYDDLRLFSDLGYDVFMPGAYSDPSNPGENSIRPALPNAPHHPELNALCDEQRGRHGPEGLDMGIVDWAKADLHPKLIDWADIIMVNCFPDTWIGYQWERIREKRVIWRTIGQSNPHLEHEMRRFEGLEIVRYSPAEKRAFEPLGVFAGEDALIRFCKYPSDFGPWIGDDLVVGNITQNLDLRGDHCGLDFWQKATEGLPTKLAGLGSERLGGLGLLSYQGMLDYLSHIRAYLYMGTQPASYTLSLMEAMLAGVPVVSIGPEDMWMPALFEGHEIASYYSNDSEMARASLLTLLDWRDEDASILTRARADLLFSPETIGPQWLDFLGSPVAREREAVSA